MADNVGGPEADLTEQKDTLDVAIAHERAELDRLQRRLDRVDTQASAIAASASAIGALAASVLAAVHRHIDVAGIVFIIIGGLGVGTTILVAFLSREPRFRDMRRTWIMSRWVIRILVERQTKGFTSLPQWSEKLRATLGRVGAHLPQPPEPSDRQAVTTYLTQLIDDVHKLQEDRLIAPITPFGVSALAIREKIFWNLIIRVEFLEELTEWRERLARISLLLLTLAAPAFAISVVVTVAR
jgi:hypothetical protein